MTWRIHPYLSFPSIISYSITDQVRSYKNKLTNVINSFSHGIKRICKCLISFLIQTHVKFFQCKKLDTYIYRCQRNINSKILVGSGGCSFFCINSQNNIILALYVIHSINMIMIHRTKINKIAGHLTANRYAVHVISWLYKSQQTLEQLNTK